MTTEANISEEVAELLKTIEVSIKKLDSLGYLLRPEILRYRFDLVLKPVQEEKTEATEETTPVRDEETASEVE